MQWLNWIKKIKADSGFSWKIRVSDGSMWGKLTSEGPTIPPSNFPLKNLKKLGKTTEKIENWSFNSAYYTIIITIRKFIFLLNFFYLNKNANEINHIITENPKLMFISIVHTASVSGGSRMQIAAPSIKWSGVNYW